MEHIKSAFHAVCKEAKEVKKPIGKYVSLYVKTPFYGGPQEGGWWGADISIICSQHFQSEEQADAARNKIEALARDLNEEAKKKFGRQCLLESAWLEARGLDDSFLPEPDGEIEYLVRVEDVEGFHESHGSRHYE